MSGTKTFLLPLGDVLDRLGITTGELARLEAEGKLKRVYLLGGNFRYRDHEVRDIEDGQERHQYEMHLPQGDRCH